LKKSTSLLLSGILVSGMVLGTVVTPTTIVNAAEDGSVNTDTTNNNIENKITYVLANGETVGVKDKAQGTTGQPITNVPDGYALAKGENAVYGKDGAEVVVKVTPMITSKIHFVDQNDKLVKTESVNGGEGTDYTITTLPDGCSWPKDANKTITLTSGEEYNIPVEKKVSNTVIFKTANEDEAGKTTIFGDKAGDKVTLTDAQIPTGFNVADKTMTLQTEGNTQFVTVTKDASGITPFKGVVRINTKGDFAPLYTVTGGDGTRGLKNDSEWQTNNKLVLDDVTYYQVSTTEWVKASDITVVSHDEDNTTTDDSSVQKADKTQVTTKNKTTSLYTKENKEIESRGLAANTPWATDQMITVNNVKLYRVATNEWVRASDIL